MAVLRRVPLFGGMTDAELEAVLADAEAREYAPGQDIVSQGDVGDSFFLVLQGRARVLLDGKPRRTVGPGHYVGEMALLDAEPRSATVRAETDVRGLTIPADAFLSMLEGNWAMARKVLAHMSRRVRSADRADGEANGSTDPAAGDVGGADAEA